MIEKLRLHVSQIVLVVLLFAAVKASGQDMLGVAFSNYSGVSSAAINPAFLTGTRVFMDVNIFSGNVSVANNMIYFSPDNNTIRKAVRSDPTLFTNGRFNWGRTFNYYNNTQDKYASSSVKLVGPSVMIQAGRHSFGLTSSARSNNSGHSIPYHIPIFSYQGLSYTELQNQEFDDSDYGFVSLTWSEVGLSYAYDFFDLYSNRLTFGVTVKALFGYEGGYVIMNNTRYVVPNERDVDFKNLDAEIGFSLPVNYEESGYVPDYSPFVKGYGAGIDIGFVYTKLKSTVVYERDDKLCARPYNDYKYKIGISLLDLGAITFKENAEVHKFENVSKNWVEFDTIHYLGIHNALETYSRGFFNGDPNGSYSGDQIRIGMPATISLQFDYHLRERLYIAALWMHPIRFDNRTVWRPSQIAVIPRYENRFIGVSVPFSLFDYSDPRIGLAVRIYSLTLGTDRLGSLLGVSNLNGMDFYFSFRFNIGKGACASSTQGACQTQDFGNSW